MELVRVEFDFAERDALVEVTATRRTLLRCRDATTVLVLAAMADELVAPLGIWLDVSTEFPAALAARDLATLAQLVNVRDAAVGAPTLVAQHAAIVAALLSGGPTTLENDAGVLRGAYNRPVPPAPITVWCADEGRLRTSDTTLSWREREEHSTVVLERFSD